MGGIVICILQITKLLLRYYLHLAFITTFFQLADFGLLRHASKGDTETVNIKGTPIFMAPEAMRGDISVKVDVFCFGAVMLEVLTGLKAVDPARETKALV